MCDMTIGGLARQAGVNVETVRYYQRLGLLELPEKPQRGIRRYGNEALSRVRFIKRAHSPPTSLHSSNRACRTSSGCAAC
jgi:MerR family mercuric resistance operon transcriptional regulator